MKPVQLPYGICADRRLLISTNIPALWFMTFRLHFRRPWQQRANAFGLILVVRHPLQQDLEILQNIKLVCLCRKCKAVYNGTCPCPVYRIMEKKILSSNDIGSGSILGRIIGNRTPPVFQIIFEPLTGIRKIIDRFFKFVTMPPAAA